MPRDENRFGSPADVSTAPLLHIEEGAGKPLIILQGFGTLPTTYRSSALLLGRRCRVIVPAIYWGQGMQWSADKVRHGLHQLLDDLEIERATFLAHSFGGGILLEFVARHEDRVADLVFADTLGMAHQWKLAREAARHPLRLLWMATPTAARDFGEAVINSPGHLIQAAWWGFESDRRIEALMVRERKIKTHVLWASRDSLLSRDDGKAFAADMDASFEAVESPLDKPVDHDWVYRHPWLLEERLEALDLWALRRPAGAQKRQDGSRENAAIGRAD